MSCTVGCGMSRSYSTNQLLDQEAARHAVEMWHTLDPLHRGIVVIPMDAPTPLALCAYVFQVSAAWLLHPKPPADAQLVVGPVHCYLPGLPETVGSHVQSHAGTLRPEAPSGHV